MKHCVEFKPMDVWFLYDNEKFVERKLSFGVCPVCNKPIAILIQFNCLKKSFEVIKKIGIVSQKFVEMFKSQKYSSLSQINKLKFKQSTYGWVYGINTYSKNKTKQYATDFYGNKVLIKQI